MEARRRGFDPIGADQADFDLTDHAAVQEALRAAAPDAVIHCAAYTAVDQAESERDLAYAVNEGGTRSIAEYCGARGIWLSYISSDYVFDGSGTRPWEPHDSPAPLSVYGATKLAGEAAIEALCEKFMIVRTSWVFGSHGNNFVKTMLRLGAQRDSLKVVDDQVGAPTYAADLAALLCDMTARPQRGIYHAANAGECSWAGFAAEIMRQAGLNCVVEPIPSVEYPTPAPRPKNSRLSPKALLDAGYTPLPPWQTALAKMLNNENN